MSVMNEQPQQLMRSADRPGVSLPVLALSGPNTARRELFIIFCIGLDSSAALQDMLNARRPGKNFPLGDGGEAYLHLIACPTLAMTSLHTGWCEELTPKTTESHWSGGQREP
jgi:hypothetical protein